MWDLISRRKFYKFIFTGALILVLLKGWSCFLLDYGFLLSDKFEIQDIKLQDTQKEKEERDEVEVEKESFLWMIVVIGILLIRIVVLLVIIALKFRKTKKVEPYQTLHLEI